MNGQAEIYRAQALEMRDQADAAMLANVRDRCLRAAEACDEMALRAERHRAAMAKTEAAKARAAAGTGDGSDLHPAEGASPPLSPAG